MIYRDDLEYFNIIPAGYLGLSVEEVGLTSALVVVLVAAAAARRLSRAAEVNKEAESRGPKDTKLLKP